MGNGDVISISLHLAITNNILSNISKLQMMKETWNTLTKLYEA